MLAIMKKPKREKFPRYYYHVSPYMIGFYRKQNNVVFRPLTSEESICRPEEEPQINRTCVTPSIAHCFTAVSSRTLHGSKWYLYRTKRKIRAFYPYKVQDARITQEKWLLNPVHFCLFGIFEAYKLNVRNIPNPTFCCGVSESLKEQTSYLKRLQKIITPNIIEATKLHARWEMSRKYDLVLDIH